MGKLIDECRVQYLIIIHQIIKVFYSNPWQNQTAEIYNFSHKKGLLEHILKEL